MLYFIYPYKTIKPWFCEWSAKEQPKLIRHMCFGLAFKKSSEIHVLFLAGKALVCIEGHKEIKVFPKFIHYGSVWSWLKVAFGKEK